MGRPSQWRQGRRLCQANRAVWLDPNWPGPSWPVRGINWQEGAPFPASWHFLLTSRVWTDSWFVILNFKKNKNNFLKIYTSKRNPSICTRVAGPRQRQCIWAIWCPLSWPSGCKTRSTCRWLFNWLMMRNSCGRIWSSKSAKIWRN